MNLYTIYMHDQTVIQIRGIDYSVSDKFIFTVIGEGMATQFVANWGNISYVVVDDESETEVE